MSIRTLFSGIRALTADASASASGPREPADLAELRPGLIESIRRQAAHLDWTPQARAALAAYAPDILQGIQKTLLNGVPLGDIVIFVHEEGTAGRMLHREVWRQALAKYGQAGEWCAKLAAPAPPGCFWLFISGEGSGAILEAWRPEDLRAPQASA